MRVDNSDLQCTCEFTLANTAVVNFVLVEWFGVYANGERVDYAGNGQPEELFEKADKTATGSVKWDGCSNWNLLPDNCCWHGCSGADIDRLHAMMKWVYAEATKLLVNWDGD